jgi:glycosyltransferase involved in cell wall biosynthesis
VKKVHYINNGVDIEDFDKNKVLYQIEDIDLENHEIFKVIYLGSLRLANDLKQLVDAAKLLKQYNNIQFYIYGDGPDRVFLEKYCIDNEINNVKFKQKWIDIKYVPYVLSKSSLNILNYRKSDITRFGGSQSKSFQYMASGKPICSNIKMNFCPITKYNIGTAQDFESPVEYANAILSFAKMNKKDYDEMCVRARNAAKNYDYEKLTLDFEKLI